MLVYWLIFAMFAAGAISYASNIAKMGVLPVSGPAAELIHRRSAALLFAAIALILLIGLRYQVGGDWANYRELFKRIAPQDLSAIFANFSQEPGYTFLNWLAGRFGAGLWFVDLLCALPFVYGLMRLCRQQPNPWLALLIATPFLIIVVGMGYTRQAAALGFLLVGLTKIVDERPPIHFIMWTLVGALFHRTVLAFIPIMLVSSSKNKLISYTLMLVSIVLSYFTVLPSAIDQYAPGYIHEKMSASGATVRVLMDVLPAIVVLLSGGRFYWSAGEKNVWRTYAALCLIAGAALPFIESSVVVDRLAIYLIPVQIFVYSRIGYCFGLIHRGWLAWTAGVLVYSAAVQLVWLNYAVNAFAWIPYQNYLTAPERN